MMIMDWLRRYRATVARRFFEDKMQKRPYPYALETTTKVRPDTMPGDHYSYVNERGNRLWAFRRPEDLYMARRIAGSEVIER